jgi:hypothetical protein
VEAVVGCLPAEGAAQNVADDVVGPPDLPGKDGCELHQRRPLDRVAESQ